MTDIPRRGLLPGDDGNPTGHDTKNAFLSRVTHYHSILHIDVNKRDDLSEYNLKN